MESPNIPARTTNVQALTAKPWSGTLDKVAQGKTSSGRTVVFISKQGDMRVFDDKAAAEKAGYRKLRYEDIVKISKQIIEKDNNPQDKFEVGKKLNELTVRRDISLAQKYKSSSLNPINQLKGTIKKSEVKSAQKLVQATGATESGSPAQLEALDKKIATVQHIERSEGGILGVIFLKSNRDDGEQVVMKFLTNASPVRLAENLYKKAGFATANPIFISRESDTVRAKKLAELGKRTHIAIADKPGKPPMSNQDRENIIKTRQANLNMLLKAHEEIQISQDVHAVTLNDSTMVEDRLLEVLGDRSFVKDLGRLAVYDAFMGNSDRMQPWVIGKELNNGNIMVRQTEEGNRLVLIDNDGKISRDDRGMSDLPLQVLFEKIDGMEIDSYYEAFKKDFIKRFGHEIPIKKEDFMAAFKEGVLSASKELITAFPTETEFILWEETSGAGRGSVDIAEAQKRLNFIKQHIQ